MADNLKESTCQLTDLAGPVVDVAYDVTGRRMATCTSSMSGGSIVQAYERGPGSSGWSQVSAWETDVAVTHLAWAHPEYGRVLAGGTSTGSVLVWGQLPELQVQASLGLGPGAGGGEAAGGFQPLAELPCGTAPCRALAFAPRQTGLVLAALCDDGCVCVHEADEVLAPRAWSLHSKVKAGLPGYCRGLCWRPFTPGMPPMLCMGVGQQVCVWQYVLALNTWQVVLRLDTPGQDVASVHWAPPLGRPAETLAVGAGRDLVIFSLSGDTSALVATQLAAIEHDDAVWKVEWDLWGNQVAAATDGQQVHVYKPDLVGSWVKLAWVQGQEPEA